MRSSILDPAICSKMLHFRSSILDPAICSKMLDPFGPRTLDLVDPGRSSPTWLAPEGADWMGWIVLVYTGSEGIQSEFQPKSSSNLTGTLPRGLLLIGPRSLVLDT